MKKLILLITLVFGFLCLKADQNVDFGGPGCYDKISASSWYLPMGPINSQSCVSNFFYGWVRYNGITYGPLTGSLLNGYAIFILPSALQSILASGQTIEFSYDWSCINNNSGINPFLMSGYGIWQVGPCPSGSTCVANFSINLSTLNNFNGTSSLTLDDEDNSYLDPIITSFQSTIDCTPISPCEGYITHQVKVTDKWVVSDGSNNIITTIVKDNISNPTMYTNQGYDLLPFTIYVTAFNVMVCHTKTIEDICKFNSSCPWHNFSQSTLLYDCTVCRSFCLWEVTEEIVSYLDPPSSNKPNNPNISLDEIQIYPNPAQKSISIKGLKDKTEITIINLMGEAVHSEIIQKSELNNPISISNLPNGLYILKAKSSGQEQIKKFVINK